MEALLYIRLSGRAIGSCPCRVAIVALVPLEADMTGDVHKDSKLRDGWAKGAC